MYQPIRPSFLGRKIIKDIDLLSVIARIDWKFFFLAWKVSGHYDGLETLCDCEACKVQWLNRFRIEDKEKAKEAYQLFRDAQEELRNGIERKRFQPQAIVYFAEARSEGEGISILEDEKERLYLPMLRQQHPSEKGDFCLSVADFISPRKDYIGIFAVTIHGGDEWSEEEKKKGDDYRSLLIKSIADRLAEATAVWLHEKIRNEYWGYGEVSQAEGIRPAFGYPSIPDLSMLFEANKLINLSDIGITLTENGAMKPNASICALHISHPKAFYFMVGKVGEDQMEEYAKQRGKSVEELKRWMMQ